MAASANDKARKSYSYLQKTLNSTISDVATALTPNNLTSVPTDTGVSFVVDRVDSAGNKTPALRELMTGVVSGITIASLQRGEQGTTAQQHLANAVIEFVNSGEMWNDLIDFLLQDHSNPNGNHKTLTDDNGNEWLERGSTASAVNQVKVSNAATGGKPVIEASGDDTNISIQLKSKGTGDVELVPASTGLAKVDGSVPRSFFALFNFIESGLVLTADNVGVNKNYSISSGVVWIAGKRLTVAAVSAQTVGASKDRYCDLQDNGDGTAVYTNTEVANNAASPAIPNSKADATNIRFCIVVAGATTIAATTSLNQGELDRVLPIASSIPYCFTDSIGNIINPRDPNRKMLGYRQIIANQAVTVLTDLTGLNFNAILYGRPVKVSGYIGAGSASVANNAIVMQLVDVTASSAVVAFSSNVTNASGDVASATPFKVDRPAAGVRNYKAQYNRGSNAATANTNSGATNPSYIMLEQE